jgi:hypothetical protein
MFVHCDPPVAPVSTDVVSHHDRCTATLLLQEMCVTLFNLPVHGHLDPQQVESNQEPDRAIYLRYWEVLIAILNKKSAVIAAHASRICAVAYKKWKNKLVLIRFQTSFLN